MIGKRRLRELEPVDVCFMADASYPYHRGGVAAIIHQMISELPQMTFGVIHIAWDESSRLVPAYSSPPNLRWVDHLFLSPKVAPPVPMPVKNIRLQTRGTMNKPLPELVLQAIQAANQGDYQPFWSLFDLWLNPLTRPHQFWKCYRGRQFPSHFLKTWATSDMTPAQLFWLQRQLFSMASALWDRVYPRADIYHAQTQHYAGIAAVLAARQHARKSVVTEHGLYVRDAINLLLRRPVDREVDPRVDAPTDQHEESLATWMNWFYHGGELVYEAADVFTYQYRQNIESARRLGAKPEKIRTIVNGIDGDRFAMTRQLVERRHGQRRQSNSWTWKVALVGRVVELKGVMDLIHAAEIIRDSRRANVLIEVMGPLDDDPEFVARCHREIQTLGLGNLIQLVGTRKVAEELAHVDLVVMPSHTEAFPVALLEAMASGLPVIASDVGCIREALVERLDAGATTLGPAGVVVPPRAPRQLARAMLDLMADSDRMERYSRNAILRVEARYRSRDVMKSYMRLYADLGCQAAMVALDGIRAKSARGRSA